MRFVDASLAAVCFVQLFATGWCLSPPDQLLADSPNIDNGFAGPPLREYATPALRKRQSTASTSSDTSSGTSASSSSSSSSSGVYTNSTMSSTMSSTSSMSSSANSTSSRASSTTSSSTTASASPTTVDGVTFEIQNNTIYSGTLLNLMRKRAADSGIDMCLNKCASNSTCQGTAYDNTTNACTYYSSVNRSSQVARNGTTFALVENRPNNSTSSSTMSSSTMTKSMNSTSSHSMSMTANSTSSHSSTTSSKTTSSTSATPTNHVGARTCQQIAAAGSTFTGSNNVIYAVICSKMNKRMLLDGFALSPKADGDLGTAQSGSFEGCAPYCDQNSQCNSYSYTSNNGTCYLSSSKDVTQPIAGRDYAYKVQNTTSSSSTSTSSSTSDFVPDGYSISKTTICETPTGASVITASATSSSSTTSSSSFLSMSSSSVSSSTPSSSTPTSSSSSSTSPSSSAPSSTTLSSSSTSPTAQVRIATQVRVVADRTRTVNSKAPAVQTVISVQTKGAVVTSYSVVSSGSTFTIMETATSVRSIYTSTKRVASLRRSTVTTLRNARPSNVTVGTVTVTSDVVIPSGYTTITASGSTVTHSVDRTVATGVATVTAPASTVTTTVATYTASGSSTVTSGISTVTMDAASMEFLTVVRREEKPLQDAQIAKINNAKEIDEEKHDDEKKNDDERKIEHKRQRPWIAFDGLTEMWM
ncbi:hypothetical protein QM012_000746 [Aureobasidium pullulans]|uniref:Apple domain-containing protein n=1 Tax=Aureobasidium pullulans TaxID=5580 RepID=A0ABR0TWR4_AURPU